MPKMKNRLAPRQPPGPDYRFTLDDLQRMVEQLGGRIQFQIYPKELDAERLELERLRQLHAESALTRDAVGQ